jgi:hypothetical protein
MSNLWTRAAAFQLEADYESASPEAQDRRRQRVEHYLDHQGYTTDIPHKWGPRVPGYEIHGLIMHHDGPEDLRHWEHIPDDVVSLRQPIYQHQGHAYTDVVRSKIREDFDNEYYEEPDDYQSSGGPDPKFVRHQGKHYLLDGHHRFTRARLMGHSSMWGRVFDTANPDHKQSNCAECHENKHYDEYDEPHSECSACRQFGLA